MAYHRVDAVATRLGLACSTIRSYIETGKLKALKPGKCFLISDAALREFERSMAVAPAALEAA